MKIEDTGKVITIKKLGFISLLFVIGILISYIEQMAPSPLLGILRDHFNVGNNDALLNLSVSIIFPMIIIASIVGGFIEQKAGIKNLFSLSMLFLAIGILMNYVAVNYTIFLLGRALFGIGFGLGIPFIGSAIMKWYTPKQREIMNTINGLFPFVGAVVSFSVLVPIYNIFNDSWKHAIGIWGVAIVIVLVLWNMIFHEKNNNTSMVTEVQETNEKKLYINLWKRRSIKLICITFACDFFCYSYIAVILPTFLLELGHMTETVAGLWAAIAFPAVGIIGGLVGGIVIAKTGKRRPSMAIGQILKTIGILTATLGAGTSVVFTILGVSIFGFGNALWMPGMYTVPMELEDMNPTRVGAAFALISSCGFVSGFISPIIGGWLTNELMVISGIADPLTNHVFGLQWSLFIFGFINLIGFVCILKMKETGPAVLGVKTETMEVL